MKKIVAIFLTLMLALILISCGTKEMAKPSMPSYTPKPTETESIRKSLQIEKLGYYPTRSYITVKYKITNNHSSHIYKFIEVKVNLMNKDQKVITSDWTYAVGNEGLNPGDSKEFEIMIDTPSEDVEFVSCFVIDYE
jgi:hypothetical protein